jgi:hypothetical protein
MIGRRVPAVVAMLGLAAGLASCSSFSGYVADHWPHWAGGMPADVPPRPGAPGYAEFVAHGQTAPDATTNTTPAAAPQFTATGGQTAAPPKKPASRDVATGSRSNAAPPAAPQKSGAPENNGAPEDDVSATRGGLY